MSFMIGFGLGFVVGWIVFQRPQWATDFWYWIKMKIWGGN